MTTTTKRGVCPVCGKDVALNKFGLVRQHGTHTENNMAVHCPGTYGRPVA